jgi:hypothetical protein
MLNVSSSDDDSVDTDAAKNIGQISLSIWRVEKGERIPAMTFRTQLPQDEKVHERSKKAIAHRVGCVCWLVLHRSSGLIGVWCSFGEEKHYKTLYVQDCRYLDKTPLVTFIFIYRPLGESIIFRLPLTTIDVILLSRYSSSSWHRPSRRTQAPGFC